MIPAILSGLGGTLVASLVDRIWGGGSSPSVPSTNFQNLEKALEGKFEKTLDKRGIEQEIQHWITMQRDGAYLPISKQLLLGKYLLNQMVHVTDAFGHSKIGVVQDILMQNGKVDLLIHGNRYPITTLQAYLPELKTESIGQLNTIRQANL